MSPFDQPLEKAFGAPTAKTLAKALGVTTVGELLAHYPRRYNERGELTEFTSLEIDEQVTVMARVEKVNQRRRRNTKGTILDVVVTDGTDRLALTWFNQPWHAKKLTVGRVGLFSGKVSQYRGVRQLANAEYQLMAQDGDLNDLGALDADPSADEAVSEFAGAIVPVYPAASSLPTWRIAKCVAVILDGLGQIDDPIPEAVRASQGVIGLRQALIQIHRPNSLLEVEQARARLIFDEAFVLQTILAQQRAAMDRRVALPREHVVGGLRDRLDAQLPFDLTKGQREIAEVISSELARAHPMHRLLQGEVGSGKTIVALRAMLEVIDAGGQCALLAPTEVLAQQHFRSITSLMGALADGGKLGGGENATCVVLLTGSTPTALRRDVLAQIESGQAGIVIGTHAIIQESVKFADLGLLVIDEQHRFGVEQRAALTQRSQTCPHVLVMTATPIPRTVAMTVFGDLETSTLSELPAGRSTIVTHVVPTSDKPHFLERAWQRVREEVANGHQVYVVCSRIGDDDSAMADDEILPAELTDASADTTNPTESVVALFAELAFGQLHDLRLSMLHGRMKAEEKDAVMREFSAGNVDVLVSTTVIEVGVDVPNATMMVIMDADRFGVSQLHQLRGRVGRGSAPGLCLLVTSFQVQTPPGQRLEAVASTTDGFKLSRLDLELRREGDVLGATQSGRRTSLRLLSVLRDEHVIVAARDQAVALVAADPDLQAHPALRELLEHTLSAESVEFLDKT
ncbi:unannotated protein [freshwater metagenome]|uniref:ATP-dependent DNA helicase RecG n=1 Tax=freshwater metagenome TaxID=449393 RepID=A0A6J7E915_9ZZZZ|nr:ATP-dependent DNA helicase RecG [Actinomycetota bacterium]